ncbi:MAG: glycerol-3-phosphate dehydrogenase [Alphaproteobacteria bacterium]|nr:glycerol-3-phosphate dehydrogenase [Alphaproteobacteria bacterium]
MEAISLIGCGRWGTFLGWYAGNYCKFDRVDMYDIPTSPNFIELKENRKNAYLSLSDNMVMHENIEEVLGNEIIIVSIGCQHLRSLAKQINNYNVNSKTFLLAMKGLEEPSAKTLELVFREEVKQDIHVAILAGPGHVQDYMKKVPSCAVIDSYESATKDMLIRRLSSDLIRFYYGTDMVGNQIGAALKNVIGIAAGILDGLEWYGLKGALMARAPIEVGRFIKHFGGNPQNAYGLAHLGDYEATLFSKHSHNRSFGEMLAKGENFGKLAEGVATLKAVKIIADTEGIDMPIAQALYKVVYEQADIKTTLKSMFERDLKKEFDNSVIC